MATASTCCPFATFALNTYKDDPCTCFKLKGSNELNQYEVEVNLKMHKAISIIQFKAEGQLIKAHPEYHMEQRNLLHRIDYEHGTITLIFRMRMETWFRAPTTCWIPTPDHRPEGSVRLHPD